MKGQGEGGEGNEGEISSPSFPFPGEWKGRGGEGYAPPNENPGYGPGCTCDKS